MELILIRHAQAEISFPDEKRDLTSRGIKEFKQNSKILKENISSIDLILSSPFDRALQTGDILSKEYKIIDSFFIEKTLSPGCDSSDIIDLSNIYDVEKLVCIFHLPDIAYCFSKFCPIEAAQVNFNPGSIAVISFQDNVLEGKGNLKLYIP